MALESLGERRKVIFGSYFRRFTRAWAREQYVPLMRPTVEVIAQLTRARREAEVARRDDISFAYLDADLEDDPWFMNHMIETHLGTVLIVCQAYITRVCMMTPHLRGDAKTLCDVDLSEIGTGKADLLAVGEPVAGTRYTAAQVINALANYFKHHEEWNPKWEGLGKDAQYTADVIRALGGRPGVSIDEPRNLETCLGRLVGKEHEDLFRLPELLDTWKRALWAERYEKAPMIAETLKDWKDTPSLRELRKRIRAEHGKRSSETE
jgi:hypothetical protein